MYHPGRWFARFLGAGAFLPWLAFAAVQADLISIIDTAHFVVPGVMIFAAGWNFALACLVGPVALMLVESTRQGPISWYRLDDDERELFAKAMFATFCILTVILFALVWREQQLAVVPVLMTSFLPALVASLAGVLVATTVVAGRHMRQRRKTGPAPT